MAYDWKTELPGVFSHHAETCPVRDGGEDTCGPLGYRSSVRDLQTNRRSVSPTFETAVEALAWQRDQLVSDTGPRETGVDRAVLGAVIDEYLQAADDGLVRDGHGERYTRDSLRALRGALSYADSELGTMNVQDIRRRHVQSLINQLDGSGVEPARIAAVTEGLRDLYTYAIKRDLVGFSPIVELELPQSQNGVPHSDNGVPYSTNGVPYNAPPAPTPETANPSWTTGEPWTPPPPPSPPQTPPPFDAYGRTTGGFPTPPAQPPPPPPYPTQAYTGEYAPPAYAPPAYAPPGYPTGGFITPPPAPPGYESGSFSGMFGTQTGAANANYDATMQERWLWWTVRIVVIVFVLIALVLVAESV